MKDMKRDEMQANKLVGVSMILGALPKGVYYSVIFLVFVFIGIAAWFHHDSIQSFVNTVLVTGAILIVTGIIVYYVKLAYRGYIAYQDACIKALEKRKITEQVNKARLTNLVLETKVDMQRLKPDMMRYAISQGFNVEYDDLKVFDWKSSMHALQSPQGIQQISMPTLILPAKTEMIEVARRQQFSRENLFLALAPRGDVTTKLEYYLHCANDGNTGSGKTSNWRGQMVQFLKADIDCILLNPNFCLVSKNGDDWKPIARALQGQGSYDLDLPRVVTKLDNIGSVLDYMANTEVDRRFSMMREGDFSYKPLYLFIDEWPEIALKCKGANDNLGTLLRRGRAVELCVSVNSQGFLKEDTDLKGSARENFATAFFLGGSTYSGAKLLDISQKDLEAMLTACQEPIGMGVAVLRSNKSLDNPEIVRLPYADNDFLYYMLGRDDSYRLPPETVVESEHTPVNADLDRVYEACIQLQESGKSVSARSVEGVTGINRTTCNRLIGVLESQGLKVR